MGSTSWTHFIPYQPDVVAAIRAYQEELFAAGDYSLELVNDPNDYPTNLAELLANDALADAGGTHSLLDIATIRADARPLAANGLLAPGDRDLEPLPDDLLRAAIDGLPQRTEIRELLTGRQPYQWWNRSWSGYYLVTYDHDQPAEIAIWGRSGY